ncbi:MAG: hypothetical protein AB8F74_09220, partial [Saprospiraceae bacterium]
MELFFSSLNLRTIRNRPVDVVWRTGTIKNETDFFFNVLMIKKRATNLMRWVVGGQSFVNACQAVMRNKGSSGVEGAKAEDLPEYL